MKELGINDSSHRMQVYQKLRYQLQKIREDKAEQAYVPSPPSVEVPIDNNTNVGDDESLYIRTPQMEFKNTFAELKVGESQFFAN